MDFVQARKVNSKENEIYDRIFYFFYDSLFFGYAHSTQHQNHCMLLVSIEIH